ncbi:hypothetical protein K439DRAFT_1621099 [Ramaria rubella]|nr:hypothetical protein K439DRAFT_1621099 [Ramaria rubella]
MTVAITYSLLVVLVISHSSSLPPSIITAIPPSLSDVAALGIGIPFGNMGLPCRPVGVPSPSRTRWTYNNGLHMCCPCPSVFSCPSNLWRGSGVGAICMDGWVEHEAFMLAASGSVEVPVGSFFLSGSFNGG